MDAIEALKTRRSVRSFRSEPVPREIIEDIIDCGRLAATAINIQPWEFIVITNPEMRNQIAATADHGPFISQAPVCIIVVSKEVKYYLEDGSAATQNMLVAAHAHGLGSCWVAGDKKDYAPDICKMVGAPKGCKLISLLAIGYSDEVSKVKKRPLKDVIHWEKY